MRLYTKYRQKTIVALDKGRDSVSVLISCPAFFNFEGESGSNGLMMLQKILA